MSTHSLWKVAWDWEDRWTGSWDTWIKTSTESLTSEPRVTEVTAFENIPSKVILSRL